MEGLCFGHAIHILVDVTMKTCWYRNHLEEDMEVYVGLQRHYDAGLAVSGFKNGALTYLVVLLGRILGRREALFSLHRGKITNTQKASTYIHAVNWNRTHDSSVPMTVHSTM